MLISLTLFATGVLSSSSKYLVGELIASYYYSKPFFKSSLIYHYLHMLKILVQIPSCFLIRKSINLWNPEAYFYLELVYEKEFCFSSAINTFSLEFYFSLFGWYLLCIYFSGVLNLMCDRIPENSSSSRSLSLKMPNIDRQNL